jgi:hypothetical protein
MDTANFIEAFRRLQKSDREQALQALTQELSPYEWRFLHAITSTTSFQCDIIGKLPIELVSQIFQHLSTTSPYRYQTVSRRWNHTLRSLHILKASLAQWYLGALPLQDITSYDFCLERAKSIHAFRTGNPNSIYKITPTDKQPEVLLRGDNLIWQQPQNYRDTIRTAHILHLPTWTLRTICGEAREQLRDIFASEEVVVLAPFASTCYVHLITGIQGFKKFRVPHKSYLGNVGVRGRTVACVADLGSSTDVYIWHYDNGKGHSFKIKHEPGDMFSVSDPSVRDVHAMAPLIQPDTKTIIVFTNAYGSRRQPHHRRNIAYARYTYAGECIGNWQPSLPGIGNIMSWSTVRSFVPTGYDGQWAVRMSGRPWSTGAEGESRVTTSFLLKFDEKDNHMSVWDGSQLPGTDNGWYTGGCMAWWKDTCYGHLLPPDSSETRDMLAFMGTEDDRKYKALVQEGKEIKMAHAWETVAAPVQINEKYVLRNVLDRCFLLCFDEDECGKRPKCSGQFFDQGTVEVLK